MPASRASVGRWVYDSWTVFFTTCLNSPPKSLAMPAHSSRVLRAGKGALLNAPDAVCSQERAWTTRFCQHPGESAESANTLCVKEQREMATRMKRESTLPCNNDWNVGILACLAKSK
eukprot:6489570-Amphidinium_carterae.2